MANYNTLIFLVSKFYFADKIIIFNLLVLFKRNRNFVKKISKLVSVVNVKIAGPTYEQAQVEYSHRNRYLDKIGFPHSLTDSTQLVCAFQYL